MYLSFAILLLQYYAVRRSSPPAFTVRGGTSNAQKGNAIPTKYPIFKTPTSPLIMSGNTESSRKDKNVGGDDVPISPGRQTMVIDNLVNILHHFN